MNDQYREFSKFVYRWGSSIDIPVHVNWVTCLLQLPHESTVSHGETIAPADDFTIARQRSVNSGTRKCARVQHVPHVRPETPTKVTHHHDDDDFEETSSNSSDKSS